MSTTSGPKAKPEQPSASVANASVSRTNVLGDGANSSLSSKPALKGESDSTSNTKRMEPTDEAVLEYLRKRGLSHAVLELTKSLEQNKEESTTSSGKDGTVEGTTATPREELERQEQASRAQRSMLSRTTGGGFGYDVDGAAQIPQWGVPDVPSTSSTAPSTGSSAAASSKDPTGNIKVGGAGSKVEGTGDTGAKMGSVSDMGVEEARSYLNSYTALQTWILSLPDEGSSSFYNESSPGSSTTKRTTHLSDIVQRVVDRGLSNGEDPNHDKSDGAANRVSAESSHRTMVLKQAMDLDQQAMAAAPGSPSSISPKPELLSVSFALLVHTYYELLEVGMVSTAQTILLTFRAAFEPTYSEELKDLDRLKSMEDVVKLSSHNSAHVDALAKLKALMIQVANYQLKKEELKADIAHSNHSSTSTTLAAKQKKLASYDQNISILTDQYQHMAKTASKAFDQMREWPFLRRARAVRWHLTLSASTYALLSTFLSSCQDLLPMSTLLQTRCEIHVEHRDPIPFIPAAVLEDFAVSSRSRHKSRNELEVQWAAPLAPEARAAIAGDDPTTASDTAMAQRNGLPFPQLHLQSEYETAKEADRAKKNVIFNRELLVNGFRRLEALERKANYEVGLNKVKKSSSSGSQKGTTGAATAGSNGKVGNASDETETFSVVNPLEPSVLLSTICSASSATTAPSSIPSSTRRHAFGPLDATSIWSESGIGVTCARLCPPDGRRIAAGCDDSAVRVWSVFDSLGSSDDDKIRETGMVLLGHKNGFPVFDVDWNRDGRHLLSAGGDGSVRLWDTIAVGPYGTAKVPQDRASSSTIPKNEEKEEDAEMAVPGLRPESKEPRSGAALAVYRGHAPACPVWSVSFAPSGYYFATAGSDATGRIWTTDRTAPVRILSGHTSASVNTIEWHPNCNYVLTGCDDKMVRMWDIQSGRCMRLMHAGARGINELAICPSGQYCAGADYGGLIHIWDLASGRKVNEFNASSTTPSRGRSTSRKRDHSGAYAPAAANMIHSLSYSVCGSVLASGGDDCTLRLWDVRGVANHYSNPAFVSANGSGSSVSGQGAKAHRGSRMGMAKPRHAFATRRTMLLDLNFTKRNLLLAVGKYTMPVPLATVVVSGD